MAHRIRQAALAGCCALLAAAAAGGGARAESLADAVTLAYQTNPTLQQQRAQLRITDEGYVQARAGYRMTGNVTASALGVWERVGHNGCGLIGFAPGCSTVNNTNSLNGQVTLSQPVYTGGRATSRVRSAEADILAGREDLRRVEGDLMLSVVQAYVNVRRDEQALNIRRDNVSVLQRQVDEVRARFDVGEVTRTDVAQSEAQLAAAESAFAAAQGQLALSRASYATVVGQSPTQLDPEPPFTTFPDTVEQAFEVSEQNNPLIRAADYAEQSASEQVALARAERLPSVSLQASYGYTQPLTPWNPSLQARTLQAGIAVQQPLFAGGAISSQIRIALERENVGRIQLEQARRTTTENVSRAWNDLLAARAAIAAGEEEVRAAKVAFEGTRAEQQVGLRTTLEVLNAQQVLRDAELSLVTAHHDEYLAAATVLNTMGVLEAKNLVPDLEQIPASHSLYQLKHATGYLPIEEGVSALDSLTGPHIVKLAPPQDAPITTGPPSPEAARPTPSAASEPAPAAAAAQATATMAPTTAAPTSGAAPPPPTAQTPISPGR